MGEARAWTKWIAAAMLAGLAAVVAHGCETDCGDGVCLGTEYTYAAGRDLAFEDWGREGTENLHIGVFVQGVADVDGATASLLADLTNVCEAIAFETGVALAVSSGEARDGCSGEPSGCLFGSVERAEQSCRAAATALASLRAEHGLQVDFPPPRCGIAALPQIECEARCAEEGCSAEIANFAARCPAASVVALCAGTCTGTCRSEAPSPCEGTCAGTCEGSCEGTCANGPGDACHGSCAGVCRGTCVGYCEMADGGECSDTCEGTCSLPPRNPRCAVQLAPPSLACGGASDCAMGCRASASARVSCEGPAIHVVQTMEATPASRIAGATFERHLPVVLMIEQRIELLYASSDAWGSLPESLLDSAAASLIPIADAQSETMDRLDVMSSAAQGLLQGLH